PRRCRGDVARPPGRPAGRRRRPHLRERPDLEAARMRFPSTMSYNGWATLRRSALLVLVVLILQVGIVSNLEAFEAFGDIVLLVAIAAGSVGGPDRGATYGFCAGLAYDLLLDT